VMTGQIVGVAPEDTLGEAAERMAEQGVGSAVVLDSGRLIGILTERDMLKAMAARVHTSDARVREWMTEDPLTATAEMEVENAAQVMLEHNFRHLPIVDDNGAVIGLVSLRRVVAATQSAAHNAA